MKKCNAAAHLLAGFAVLSLVVVPTVAFAAKRDKPGYGFCKSGAKVADTKNCKENGGTR